MNYETVSLSRIGIHNNLSSFVREFMWNTTAQVSDRTTPTLFEQLSSMWILAKCAQITISLSEHKDVFRPSLWMFFHVHSSCRKQLNDTSWMSWARQGCLYFQQKLSMVSVGLPRWPQVTDSKVQRHKERDSSFKPLINSATKREWLMCHPTNH
jgi:hypothetical protein